MHPPPLDSPLFDPTERPLLPVSSPLIARDAITEGCVYLFDQQRINSFLPAQPHQRLLFTQLLKSIYRHY